MNRNPIYVHVRKCLYLSTNRANLYRIDFYGKNFPYKKCVKNIDKLSIFMSRCLNVDWISMRDMAKSQA